MIPQGFFWMVPVTSWCLLHSGCPFMAHQATKRQARLNCHCGVVVEMMGGRGMGLMILNLIQWSAATAWTNAFPSTSYWIHTKPLGCGEEPNTMAETRSAVRMRWWKTCVPRLIQVRNIVTPG